jgi:hypothetical protein
MLTQAAGWIAPSLPGLSPILHIRLHNPQASTGPLGSGGRPTGWGVPKEWTTRFAFELEPKSRAIAVYVNS